VGPTQGPVQWVQGILSSGVKQPGREADQPLSSSPEIVKISGVPRGGFGGVQTPHPPEIPKAQQNRAKLNPIEKTVKNYWI